MRTAELVALMQRTEGVEITSYLVADPTMARSGGVRISRAGGLISWTMRSTDNGFLNRALGFGTLSEATPALLDRLERRFAAAGRPPRIAVAQGPTPRAALRLLERRGYVPEGGTEEQIYCYDRRGLPMARQVNGLSIERVRPDGAAEYAKIAIQSFSERGPWFRAIVEALVRRRREVERSRRSSDASMASPPRPGCCSTCGRSRVSAMPASCRDSGDAGSRVR